LPQDFLSCKLYILWPYADIILNFKYLFRCKESSWASLDQYFVVKSTCQLDQTAALRRASSAQLYLIT